MHVRRLLLLLALAIPASSVAAAQTAPRSAALTACQADVQRFCSGVQPGGGRLGKCLKEHARELSPQCREAARAARQNRQASPPR